MKNILKVSTLVGVIALTTFGTMSQPAEAHDGWRHDARFERRIDRREFAPVYSGYAPVYAPGYAPVVYTNHPVVTGILNAIGI
ncbi:MAG TPA: hypothetical protein V6C81_09810 [Planktothrix sp.]|jgi:hypothetical protein